MGRAGGAGENWPLQTGRSPLQAQHLLPLVLIMIHLSAVRQPLIPRLWKGQKILSTCWAAQMKACLVGVELHTEIPGAVGEVGPLAVAV